MLGDQHIFAHPLQYFTVHGTSWNFYLTTKRDSKQLGTCIPITSLLKTIHACHSLFYGINPIAQKMAKTPRSFGHSVCNWVKCICNEKTCTWDSQLVSAQCNENCNQSPLNGKHRVHVDSEGSGQAVQMCRPIWAFNDHTVLHMMQNKFYFSYTRTDKNKQIPWFD